MKVKFKIRSEQKSTPIVGLYLCENREGITLTAHDPFGKEWGIVTITPEGKLKLHSYLEGDKIGIQTDHEGKIII